MDMKMSGKDLIVLYLYLTPARTSYLPTCSLSSTFLISLNELPHFIDWSFSQHLLIPSHTTPLSHQPNEKIRHPFLNYALFALHISELFGVLLDGCYTGFADFFVFFEREGDGLGGIGGAGWGVGLVEEVSEKHGEDLRVFEGLGCALSGTGLEGVSGIAYKDCVSV